MQYLWYYLLSMNALTLLLMRADKQKARRRQWRIPEAVLLGAAFLGGSLGGTLGMMIFGHKTRKPIFSMGLPLMLLLHMGLILGYLL